MKKLSIFVFFISVLHFSLAHAGPNIQNFRPATDDHGLIIVQGSKTLGRHGVRFGFTTNYAKRALEIQGVGNSEDLLTMNATGTFGLVDFADIWIDVPFSVTHKFSGTLAGIPNTHGLGDARLGAKFQILNRRKAFVGLGFSPFLVLPTGDDNNLLGDDGVGFGGDLILDKKWKKFSLFLNLGYHGRSQQSTLSNLTVQHEMKYGAGAALRVAKGLKAQLEGYGRLSLRDNVSSPIEVLGSLRKNIAHKWNVQAGGGLGVNDGYSAPNWRAFLGVSFQPTGKHRGWRRDHKHAMPSIHFESGRSDIGIDSYKVLDRVVKRLKHRKRLEVEIHGYTDRRGSKTMNQRLARKRAERVQDYFIKRGIHPERIDIVVHGENKLKEKTKSNSAINRRVEFVLKKS